MTGALLTASEKEAEMKINKKHYYWVQWHLCLWQHRMVSAYASGSSGTKKAKVQTITEGVCIGSVDVGGMTKEEAKKQLMPMLTA